MVLGCTPTILFRVNQDLETGSNASDVTESVLDFYRQLPFNMRESDASHAEGARKHDPLVVYPCLRGYVKRKRVLEVGCGVGWFSNGLSFHHKSDVLGIDLNPIAVEQARRTAETLRLNSRFDVANLFEFEPATRYPLVVSLGVLHHTFDCHAAIGRVCDKFVEEGGQFLLGLYHEPGRRPFLNHFSRLRERGSSEADLRTEFRRLRGTVIDETHLESWFRDQVLHPYETQHTYAELRPLLESEGFEVTATSINKFGSIRSHAEIEEEELGLASVSARALSEGRYFPGFFVILARKVVKT
jgi:SAM-dependent methyltransferase